MRKSERLRLAEMQILRLEFEIEVIRSAMEALLESNAVKAPELDAGKWYKARLEK
ncbi:MAG: hypothetical protein ACO3CQ_04800 [Candidatus Nanopelagicaceae bacterium]|jgi:hypothetical protein